MNRSTLFRKGLASLSLAVVLSPFALSADIIDDLEDGNNQNETGYYWYFYTDDADGGTSEVINATKDDAGKLLMTPSASKGRGGGYAAECSWKFGANKPVGCSGKCEYGQMVGMGTMLAAEGKSTGEWSAAATTIKFWAKASAAMKITVEIATSAVTDYGYHCKTVSVGTDWTEISIDLADISQPSWAVEALLEPTDLQKIQFKISADNTGTPTTGSLYIDDVEIDATIPPQGICLECQVEPGQTVTGTLLSDFEGETDLTASKFKQRYWYVYSDSKGTAAVKSKFTAGTKIDEDDGTDKLVVEAGNTNGYNNTQGIALEFKLGESYTEGADVVSPFIGLGCMLSNSDKYAAGTDATLVCANASGATGITFDYKTEVDSDMFKGITVEFYDSDVLPPGMSFFTKLAPTRGVWKGANIPFSKLNLPEWPEKIELLNTAQATFNKEKLDKMQIQLQSVAGLTGKIYFDNFKFMGEVTSPVKYKAAKKVNSAVSSMMTSKGLKVTLPAGAHTGVVELIGTNGRVVAKENVNASNVSTLNTGKLAKGVYMLKVNTIYGNGKTYSASEKISVLN